MAIIAKLRVAALVVVAAVSATVLVAPSPPAVAVTAQDFDPGYIISDQAFFQADSMTESQIQAFLDAKVANCAASNGQPCLENYTATTYSRASAGAGHCAAYTGQSNESAARIIHKVAQACGINPQVLIVTLQKEQGLITASSPTERQYRVAMGFGCPDTADCDSAFFGFYNQVYKAAWQFRQYTNFPDRRYKIGSVPVQYHPNADCGAPTVNIRNQATANLYNYTPYQPNAAALAAGYGVGDSCSSYGNRNFWRYFSDWFGDTASEGRLAIQREWEAQGGASGPLGSAVTGVLEVSANGGGLGQAFTGGSIYWTRSTGARTVTGDIRAYYHRFGGETGYLAWPNSGLMRSSSNGGGVGQSFQGGSIYSTASGGTHAVSGPIRTVYHRNGGENGELGWPTTEVLTVTANGGGSGQSFQGGSIYSSPRGTFPVIGGMRSVYHSLQGETGSFGWPITGRLAVTANGGGFGQAFQGGSIYSSAGGSWAVSGPIRAFYHAQKGETGVLGWPTGAQACVNASTCSQSFQGGTIYWTSAGGARIGHPEIEAVHAALGGDTGTLGKAITGLLRVSANGGGIGQAFEKGSVYWSQGRGAHAVTGPIRSFYFSLSGEQGRLGWPAGDQTCAGATCSQTFQHGTVYWSQQTGARIGHPAIETVYAHMGGPTGALGLPITGLIEVAANGGGIGQAFQGGSIYWSEARGAFAVTGDIRSVYHRLRGETGVLGWPASAVLTVSANGGGTGQAFQGGSIYSSPRGTFEVIGDIRAAYHALGGEAGVLGWPITGRLTVSANGGGIGQAFQKGSIYQANGGGAFVVAGGLRDFYFSRGGEAGALGWPTSGQTCGADGTCTQSFQGGVVTWSPTTGGRFG